MAKIIELIPIKDLDLSDLDNIGGEDSPQNEDEGLQYDYGCGYDGCDYCGDWVDVLDKDGNYLYTQSR